MNFKKNVIHNEDCLDAIPKLKDKSIDLAILDPPYNIGVEEWDRIEDYLGFLCLVMVKIQPKLKDAASLYLWGSHKNNDFLKFKIMFDENTDKNLIFRNWIVWVHEVKQHRAPKDSYLDKHEDLLFYSGQNSTFNLVRDEPTPTQLKIHAGKYNEDFFIEREKLPPSQRAVFKTGLQLGSPAKSWWRGKSNVSNSKVYRKFMGYKSEWVCERIITVSSNPGDLVLVPFAGTGTECFVAQGLSRDFIGFENNAGRCKLANERLKDV